MRYELIFKLLESNVLMTDLFVPAYGEFEPLITIKNGRWEFFLSEDTLKKVAEEGFEMALEEAHKDFELKYTLFEERIKKIREADIENSSKKEFISILDDFKGLFGDFFQMYKKTEFFYFAKIEKELIGYIKDKDFSFEDVLSNKVDMVSWPEAMQKLANYISNMQHIKFKYRKLLNTIAIGQDSIFVKIMTCLPEKTGREDAVSMTVEEIKKVLEGEKIRDVSDRNVYSYITWNSKNNEFIIYSGGDAYRKIRELDKEIPKNEVTGTPASSGFVKGKVKVIPLSFEPEKYLSKMEKGDILVSDTTGPEMMVAIEKAAAIVTNEGGMMSHAAVVSREFDIPCVVGTKYATKVFKDGDIIEVNANSGIVRKV